MATSSLNCWSCGGRVAGGVCLTCSVHEGSDPLLGTQIGALRISGHLQTEPESVLYEVEPLEGEATALALRLLPRDLWGVESAVLAFNEAGRLHHQIESPNVSPCVDYGQTSNGAAWHLLQWVAGRDLRTLVRERRGSPLGLSRVLELGRQMATGLRALHEQGLLHGRLSMESFRNLSAFADTSDWIQLLHPGRCSVQAPRALVLQDSSRWQGGEPWRLYEAPEGGARTAAGDIFSIGAILYHLLAGRQPFPVRRSASDVVTPIVSRRPELKEVPMMREVIDVAMSPRPTDRYPDAVALQQALERAARNPRGLLAPARRPPPAPAAPPVAAAPVAAAPARPRAPAALEAGEVERPVFAKRPAAPAAAPPPVMVPPSNTASAWAGGVDEAQVLLDELVRERSPRSPQASRSVSGARGSSSERVRLSGRLELGEGLEGASMSVSSASHQLMERLRQGFLPLSDAYVSWARTGGPTERLLSRALPGVPGPRPSQHGGASALRASSSGRVEPPASDSLIFGGGPRPRSGLVESGGREVTPPPAAAVAAAASSSSVQRWWLALTVRYVGGDASAVALRGLAALSLETLRGESGVTTFLIAAQGSPGATLGRVIAALMELERTQQGRVPAVGVASVQSGEVSLPPSLLGVLTASARAYALQARPGEVLSSSSLVEAAGIGGVFSRVQEGRSPSSEAVSGWVFASRPG